MCYNKSMLYIDIFFLINSLLDFILLLLLALWKQEPLFLGKILAASAIGGLWACIIWLARIYGIFWLSVLTLYPTALLMIAISFPGKSWKRRMSYAGSLFVISWMGAGFLDFLYYQVWAEDGAESSSRRAVIMVLCCIAAFCALRLYQRDKEKKEEKAVIYHTEVELCGKKETIWALWDSGNRLHTMTGEPVCIVEEQVMEKIMGKQWNNLRCWTSAEDTFLEKMGFQLISYHCIGRDEGVFPAVRGDRITIQKDEETIVVEHPVIGYCSGSLQREGTDDNYYQMILPSDYGKRLWK